MKFNDLNVTKYSKKRRLGRGIASGHGKTAGRGTKGQKARAGSTKRPGFAGGQNPLMQQLPKLPGFTSYRVKAEVVSTDQLNSVSAGKVDAFKLAELGLISSPYVRFKLLYNGDISKKLTVSIESASAKAVEAIEKAGGSFSKSPRPARVSTKTDATKKAND
jgi:large subunit ribosomal protein L15